MRRRRESAPVAYILKMYPRFSETFVLNELLELERQGVTLRIFSLREPNDGILHREVELVRGDVTFVRLRHMLVVARAHARVFGRSPARYVKALPIALRRHRLASSVKHLLRAGVISDHVQREGICHIHAHFASSAASVALDVYRLTGVPYSFTADAKDIYRHGLDIGHLRTKLDQARFAVTVSDYNRDHLARLGARHVVRIYNGIDLRMALKVPVVATPVTGIPELVEDSDMGEIPHCVRGGETGLLYPPGDAEALVDALATLIEDRERAAVPDRNGREHVLRDHTWAANARAVADLAEQAA